MDRETEESHGRWKTKSSVAFTCAAARKGKDEDIF